MKRSFLGRFFCPKCSFRKSGAEWSKSTLTLTLTTFQDLSTCTVNKLIYHQMGCSLSKPWKNSDKDVVAAYQWDQRECGCGSNEFKLVAEPSDNTDFKAVKDAIDSKLYEAKDIVMENSDRDCFCAALNHEPAKDIINSEFAPGINAKIEPLGYVLDAFTWYEWHSNGQTTQKRFYLVLRIRDVGTKES
jgi:hypothetical protein